MRSEEKIAQSYNNWFRSPEGYYLYRREKMVIDTLLNPQAGEALLDIGCKTGNHLLHFRRKGCNVTGIDSSSDMLAVARKKLGPRVELIRGPCDDLPFSDNDFDIVTIITSLCQVDNVEQVLAEAIRVCRGRIFVGVYNKYSLASNCSSSKMFYSYSHIKQRLFGIFEIKRIIQKMLPLTTIQWGSVLYFPPSWYPFATSIEEKMPVIKNPFGLFIGITIPIVYTHITIQDALLDTTSHNSLQKSAKEPTTATRKVIND